MGPTKLAEFDRTQSWWHRWSRVAGAVYAALLLAGIVVLALACVAIGVAWLVIGGLVLAGAMLAALRFSGLVPLGALLGTGELATFDPSRTAKPQGFGGLDVATDARWDLR